ncbi:hypothetical protein V3F56_08995 [Moorellaceae bacterium AZ2]
MSRILEELRAELLQMENELAANSILPGDCPEEQLFSQIARYLLIASEDIWSDDFIEAITAFIEPVPLPEGFVNRVLERIRLERMLCHAVHSFASK